MRAHGAWFSGFFTVKKAGIPAGGNDEEAPEPPRQTYGAHGRNCALAFRGDRDDLSPRGRRRVRDQTTRGDHESSPRHHHRRQAPVDPRGSRRFPRRPLVDTVNLGSSPFMSQF